VLTFPRPDALHGESLTGELHAAGFPDAEVAVDDDTLYISAATEADRQAVQAVLDGHVPPPPPGSPDDDLAARIQAVHDDPDVPAAVKKLTAALLGLNGEAAVAGRPTDNAR
jgi:hypothetical protein